MPQRNATSNVIQESVRTNMRPIKIEIASLWAEIESLKVNNVQLAGRVRQLEKEMETFVTTHWYKRLWFWIDGWPSTRIVAKRSWRPWHRRGV